MNSEANKKTINYLGVDWGEKRIGLATADSDLRLSLPFKTVGSLAELLAVLKEEDINTIIIGDPIKMRGEAANSELFLDFLNRLKTKSSLEVILVDERLSSLAADAFGDSKQKAARDEIAAAIILQNYLDSNC